MKWLGIAAVFGCNSPEKSVSSGPFSIQQVIKKESSGSWYNNGTSPFARYPVKYYQVIYQGQKLALTEGDSKRKLLNKALFLKNAPQTAILAAGGAVYLLTEENQEARTQLLAKPVDGSNVCQWLDIDNGQPGPACPLYGETEAGSGGFLEGGDFILINNSCVLDISSLQFYAFDKNEYENLLKVDNYYSANESAIGFSPGKTQVVFTGYKRRAENHLLHDYALVVVDFMHQEYYALPFDQNATRFVEQYSKQAGWLNTWFEWHRDKNGRERIALRKPAPIIHWTGYFSADLPGIREEDNYYSLQPVKPTIEKAIIEYLKSEWNASIENTGDSGAVDLVIGDAHLSLFSMIDSEQRISLSLKLGSVSPAHLSLLRRIGLAFNKLLESGQYQEHFDQFH